ncbi:MAG: hypothetical protein H3Z50_01755 [archaeon]|nr:hypothetical protein [archaeon]MCP8305567.1 hypothetical protein [archaeon]
MIVSQILKCPACGKTFNNKKDLDDHVRKAHPKKK